MSEQTENQQEAPIEPDEDDFALPAKACELNDDGTCEACQ